LSIQGNRIQQIAGLESLTALEELYISYNAITSLEGLSKAPSIRILDISANPVKKLEGIEALTALEELWASNCEINNFDDISKHLGDKEHLTTVYFEGNPIQKQNPVLYRNKVRLALPNIIQVDASKCLSVLARPTG
jgi:protein phosphatase 1 regulatory subunit 7